MRWIRLGCDNKMSPLLYAGVLIYTFGFTFTVSFLLADEMSFTESNYVIVFVCAVVWPILLVWVLLYNLIWRHA